MLVDVGGHCDDCVERIVSTIGLSEPILNERRQMFSIPNQLVVVAETGPFCMLLE